MKANVKCLDHISCSLIVNHQVAGKNIFIKINIDAYRASNKSSWFVSTFMEKCAIGLKKENLPFPWLLNHSLLKSLYTLGTVVNADNNHIPLTPDPSVNST